MKIGKGESVNVRHSHYTQTKCQTMQSNKDLARLVNQYNVFIVQNNYYLFFYNILITKWIKFIFKEREQIWLGHHLVIFIRILITVMTLPGITAINMLSKNWQQKHQPTKHGGNTADSRHILLIYYIQSKFEALALLRSDTIKGRCLILQQNTYCVYVSQASQNEIKAV